MNDGLVELSVTDTGVGIAPEDQAVILGVPSGRDGRQEGEGTGLGLALPRKFVELHGGAIGVQSRVGEGSTFTFMLPLGRQE
jgi:signal transduction histidine kinase